MQALTIATNFLAGSLLFTISLLVNRLSRENKVFVKKYTVRDTKIVRNFVKNLSG